MIISNSTRTSRATFDTTEQANWSEAGAQLSDFGITPDDSGLYAWTINPIAAIANLAVMLSGRVLLTKMKWTRTRTVGSLYYYLAVAGSGLTAGQNFVGLYSGAGARLATSPDVSTDFASSGLKVATLAAPVSIPADPTGYIYFALLPVGTTPPTPRGLNPGPSIIHAGNTGSLHCFFDTTTGNTSLPATITPTTGTTTNPMYGSVGP